MEEKQDRLTGQESRFIQQLRSACVRALLAHCSTPPVCRVSCNLWGPVYHTLLSIPLSPPSQLSAAPDTVEPPIAVMAAQSTFVARAHRRARKGHRRACG